MIKYLIIFLSFISSAYFYFPTWCPMPITSLFHARALSSVFTLFQPCFCLNCLDSFLNFQFFQLFKAGVIASAPKTTSTIVSFMFHDFFLLRSKYSFRFFTFFRFYSAVSLNSKIFFLKMFFSLFKICRSCLLTWIEAQRSLFFIL